MARTTDEIEAHLEIETMFAGFKPPGARSEMGAAVLARGRPLLRSGP